MQKTGYRSLKLLFIRGQLQDSGFQNQKPDLHQIGQRLGKAVSLPETADPPQFCTPLGLKRQKRTQCYDIIRTRCTLFIWRDLVQQLSLQLAKGWTIHEITKRST